MIDQQSSPVAWALLLNELEDAAEHLQQLIQQMALDGKIDEVDFRINLAHIYAHLNRAWHSRMDACDQADKEADVFEERSRFPRDIDPIEPV